MTFKRSDTERRARGLVVRGYNTRAFLSAPASLRRLGVEAGMVNLLGLYLTFGSVSYPRGVFGFDGVGGADSAFFSMLFAQEQKAWPPEA